MLPPSAQRVPLHTAEHLNRRIRRQTEANISYYASLTPETIDQRLAELDSEWDIERALEANAASFALFGVVMGISVNRKWFAFSAVIAGFLLQHALQGWCPPVPVLRRLGFRTRAEIDRERYALKVVRGDFDGLEQVARVEDEQKVHRIYEAVSR